MRHLLQKPKEFTFLLTSLFLFFLLRFPSLFEPYWYGDEGIYETIGYALRNGRSLYTGIWDNKPPLLYVLYSLFSGDQFAMKSTSLVFGVVEIIVFYFLAKRLFKNSTSTYLSTAFFVVLYGLPIIEGNIANAENFMLLPILLAAFIIVTLFENEKIKEYSKLFVPGVLLGIAALFKIVAVFDTLALGLFILSLRLPALTRREFTLPELKKMLRIKITVLSPLLIGFLLPLILTTLYFLLRGAIGEFLSAVFTGNVGYVGVENQLIIPQGLLAAKIILLGVFVATFFVKKELFDHVQRFIILWVGLSLFSAFFSQRPYTHYLLMLLPSFSLAIGLLPRLQQKAKIASLVLLSAIVVVIFLSFRIYTPAKSLGYYTNFYSYLMNKRDVTSYRAFFDSETPFIYNVSSYLNLHVKKNEQIFIWGDFPQLYSLTKTLPSGRFTVAYHIIPSQTNRDETLEVVTRTQPRYIVILPNLSYIPFNLNSYTKVVTIGKAYIYERTF